MMIRGYEIAGRTIAMIVGAALIAAAFIWGPTACQMIRSQKAQSKVDTAQAGAASNSAADAIGTVTAAGGRETASEELTRQNARDIHKADGAGERVKPGVDYAGRAALCRREAYRNDPKCKVMKP